MGKFFKKVLKIALPVAAGFALGPAGLGISSAAGGAAIGGAAGGLASGGGIKGALLGAASGYGGSALGNSIGSSLTGTLSKVGASNAFTNELANTTLGRLASNVVGPGSGSSLIGGALGQYAGNSASNSIADALFPQGEGSPKIQGPQPFNPTQEEQLSLPTGLSGYEGLSPEQQSTNLATQGVYGGGLGPEEQKYFMNLLNRRLVDQSGTVDSDLSEVNPIEQSFLSQLGFNGNNDPRSLLEAMSKWKAA